MALTLVMILVSLAIWRSLFLRSKAYTMPTLFLAAEPMVKSSPSQVAEWFQVSENQKRR